MPKTFHKHKLLFDENMRPRTSFPRLNEHFEIKHVSHDLKMSGLTDTEVYDLAIHQGRIIITLNIVDFKKLAGTKKDAGIIGIPPHLLPPQLDNKLTSLLQKYSPNMLRGKFIPLGEFTFAK